MDGIYNHGTRQEGIAVVNYKLQVSSDNFFVPFFF